MIIEVKPCGDERRSICLYRLSVDSDDSLCRNSDTILRGCPIIKSQSGCRLSIDKFCDEITNTKSIQVNGRKCIDIKKCSHHVDEINYVPRGAQNNELQDLLDPLDAPDFIDEFEQPLIITMAGGRRIRQTLRTNVRTINDGTTPTNTNVIDGEE